MSVYTRLSLEQVQTFALPYGLVIVDLQPIQGGIENTNYFLFADDHQEYVLTVFEELNQDSASELFPILQHLQYYQIPVAVPLTYNNQPIHVIANKPAQIAPRIIGKHPIPTTIQQAKNMGNVLAKLHLSLLDFPLERKNQHGQSWWISTKAQVYPTLEQRDQSLLEQVFSQFEVMQQQHPNRPIGLIHADLFRDNSLYIDDQLSGVLDFSELSRDELLLDISITLNDFCSDFPNVKLDQNKAKAFITEYDEIRPMTTDEKNCLNTYLAMAACRFWLSRLQVAQRNQQEQRNGSDILQKDPNEMRLMLIDRLTQEYTW